MGDTIVREEKGHNLVDVLLWHSKIMNDGCVGSKRWAKGKSMVVAQERKKVPDELISKEKNPMVHGAKVMVVIAH